MPFISLSSVRGIGYREMPFEQDNFVPDIQDDTWSDDSFLENLWNDRNELPNTSETERSDEEEPQLSDTTVESDEELDILEMERLEEEALLRECMKTMHDDGYENDDIEESAKKAAILPDIEMSTLNPSAQALYVLNPFAGVFCTLNPFAQEFSIPNPFVQAFSTLNPLAQAFYLLNPLAQEFVPPSYNIWCEKCRRSL